MRIQGKVTAVGRCGGEQNSVHSKERTDGDGLGRSSLRLGRHWVPANPPEQQHPRPSCHPQVSDPAEEHRCKSALTTRGNEFPSEVEPMNTTARGDPIACVKTLGFWRSG